MVGPKVDAPYLLRHAVLLPPSIFCIQLRKECMMSVALQEISVSYSKEGDIGICFDNSF